MGRSRSPPGSASPSRTGIARAYDPLRAAATRICRYLLARHLIASYTDAILRAMNTQDARDDVSRLVRTSVLLPEETDRALRQLAAAGDRPLSREIRRALEDHVARENGEAA